MEISVAAQTWMFLLSIALGAALGVCYDVFRVLRVAFRHPSWAVLAEDILFALICTASSFLYMLCVDFGRIRFFVLIGEGVGFALYYCTVGVLVLGISKRLIAGIKWLFGWLWRIFVAPILRFVQYMYRSTAKIFRFSANYLTVKTQNSKIYLKKRGVLLYNLKKRLFEGRRKKKIGKGRQAGLNEISKNQKEKLDR